MGKVDSEHFCLHCRRFDMIRRDLFGQLSNIPGLDLVNIGPTVLCELPLFDIPRLTVIENRGILEATMFFIKKSKPFG